MGQSRGIVPKGITAYNEIREKSLLQWLDEMERHEDVAVRCGVKLCREYMQYLQEKNERQKQELALKDSYLKKIAAKNREMKK